MAFLGVLFCLVLTARSADGRSWRDIQPLHGLDPMQPFDVERMFSPRNPLNTPSPTAPTSSPTFPATSKPTALPTTTAPTPNPTAEPTLPHPTSAPTDAPTGIPDPYPFNDPPTDPDPWYFNYDMRPKAKYGPGHPGITPNGNGFTVTFKNNGWGNVDNPPDFYWKEFMNSGFGPWKGTLAVHNPAKNRCHRVGMQSPIDVRHNGGKECVEHHEVRSLPGDFRITGDRIEKRIESNKLRLIYDRRPCADLKVTECQEPDPPYADFPNGWGGFADAVHVDFKVPSEHLINGKRFDAEMQVYYLHAKRGRMPAQATVIKATEEGYNWYFEGALKAFEYVYERDQALCAATQRRDRELSAQAHATFAGGKPHESIDYETLAEFSTAMDRPDYEEYSKNMERLLQDGRWDPNNEHLVPSIHFYRYEGSITEPPCGEWVSWFITDVPMTISTAQLERMKNILFNHVDYQCRRTSVHYEHSVARPVQPTAGRPIYLCTPADFGPDP